MILKILILFGVWFLICLFRAVQSESYYNGIVKCLNLVNNYDKSLEYEIATGNDGENYNFQYKEVQEDIECELKDAETKYLIDKKHLNISTFLLFVSIIAYYFF